MEEAFATVRELDNVKQDIRELRSTVPHVIGLQSTLSDLITNVSDLKVSFKEQVKDHDQTHKDEADARVTTRRWGIIAFLTALIAIGGMYGYLTLILQSIHK